ncbi:hypothetical protein [Amycolatopsis speibonae]|uniref:Nuclear transport factor 2 family protein n=1 Tax=Amycolatopsis speibonae TaxID=1450224 RepID=A0ABV7PEY3_9PSEU
MRAALSVPLLVILGCTACGTTTTSDARPSELTPSAETTRIPVGSVAPRTPGAQSVPSAVAPLSSAENPRPDGAPFTGPAAVGTEWLREWCALDWHEPMNANLDRAARYQTTAAAKADRRTGDNEDTYRSVREQQLSSGCDEVTAAASPEAPQSADVAYLVLSARRVNSAAGKAFETEQVRSVRRVLRQADGRWLVDTQVEAG